MDLSLSTIEPDPELPPAYDEDRPPLYADLEHQTPASTIRVGSGFIVAPRTTVQTRTPISPQTSTPQPRPPPTLVSPDPSLPTSFHFKHIGTKKRAGRHHRDQFRFICRSAIPISAHPRAYGLTISWPLWTIPYAGTSYNRSNSVSVLGDDDSPNVVLYDITDTRGRGNVFVGSSMCGMEKARLAATVDVYEKKHYELVNPWDGRCDEGPLWELMVGEGRTTNVRWRAERVDGGPGFKGCDEYELLGDDGIIYAKMKWEDAKESGESASLTFWVGDWIANEKGVIEDLVLNGVTHKTLVARYDVSVWVKARVAGTARS